MGTWDEMPAKMREKYAGINSQVGFGVEPRTPEEEDQIRDIIKVPMTRPRNIFEIHLQEGFDEAHARLWNIFRHELNLKNGATASAQS